MGINIKDLGLTEERVIRELVSTPQGSIEVYEPRIDDVVFIMDLQRETIGDKSLSEVETLSFDGKTVLKTLFPRLTNIDMSTVSGEELENIIENPSIHLLIVQQYVQQIISEINVLYAEQMKTKLKESDSIMNMVSLMNEIPIAIIESAKQSGKYTELVESVEQISKEVDEAIEKENKKVEEESKVVGD